MVQHSESRDLDKIIVRVPDGMRARIKTAADANNRSMNAEIVAALEEKFPAPRSIVESIKQQVLLDLLAAPVEDRERRVALANKSLRQAGQRGRFVIEGTAIRLIEE